MFVWSFKKAISRFESFMGLIITSARISCLYNFLKNNKIIYVDLSFLSNLNYLIFCLKYAKFNLYN